MLFIMMASLQKGHGCYIHVLERISYSVPHCCTNYVHVISHISSYTTVLSVNIFLSFFYTPFLLAASPSGCDLYFILKKHILHWQLGHSAIFSALAMNFSNYHANNIIGGGEFTFYASAWDPHETPKLSKFNAVHGSQRSRRFPILIHGLDTADGGWHFWTISLFLRKQYYDTGKAILKATHIWVESTCPFILSPLLWVKMKGTFAS